MASEGDNDVALTPEEEAKLLPMDAEEGAEASSSSGGHKKKKGEDRHKSFGAVQSHLAVQDISTLDPTSLTPLSPQVISRQVCDRVSMCGLWGRVVLCREQTL
jgi:hypothetical protein